MCWQKGLSKRARLPTTPSPAQYRIRAQGVTGYGRANLAGLCSARVATPAWVDMRGGPAYAGASLRPTLVAAHGRGRRVLMARWTASGGIGLGSRPRIISASLVVLLLVGCLQKVELSDARLHISLTTPLGRNMVKDQQLRVVVDVTDASGEPIRGVKVAAEVLDAADASLGEFACKAEPDRPGRYQSRVFVPPKHASPGAWKVRGTATQAEKSVSNTIRVHVDDSLGAQVLAKQGFYLEIPPSWQIVQQEGTGERGSLLLNPMPAGVEKALLEIRYVSGDVEVQGEALREFVLGYRPGEYTEGNGYVRQIVPVTLRGHQGFLARGGFVASVGKADYNFALNVFRFYCDDSDRTFTAITASTSDSVMSEMSSILDGFECHPGRVPEG